MIRRRYWFAGTAFILISTLLLLNEYFSIQSGDENYNRKLQKLYSLKSANVNERWIVITTIAYPTSAVIALAAETGWRVVIVADTKTPQDWNHSNCDFLSIEKQKALGYSINRLIPYKSYTRKMIGYLYAIQNGAEWIYDTDDDNQPIGTNVTDSNSPKKVLHSNICRFGS
jgi:hypothetical protein